MDRERAVFEKVREFECEWTMGDRELAKVLALEFMRDYGAKVRELMDPWPMDELVRRVSTARAEGRYTDVWIAEMYIVACREPQDIRGSLAVDRTTVIRAVAEALEVAEQAGL